jgi:AmmeMemoRadiSam system protein B/AmmeMemoRadiSam system protein A
MQAVRPAAVAGSFYPAAPAALAAQVRTHLERAAALARPPGRAPKLVVVPHAGYVFSGDAAARAFVRLAPLAGRVRRVVLLGPTHRVAVRGIALPSVQAFETPLGRVPLDRAAIDGLAGLPQVVVSDRVHAQEHALEVQLPFLQTVLGRGWSLVPLAVGHADPAAVDDVLQRLWGGDETLIVVSSDLSHELHDDEARAVDSRTVARIMAFADDLRGDEACGAAPLNGALRAARRHGLQPELLDLRTSADSPCGEPGRVVGYGALAFVAPDADAPAGTRPAEPQAALGRALLAAARAEVAATLGLPAPPVPGHARLLEPGACFVSLHDGHGRLRGCVGHLQADRALGDDVRHNALAAAFGDARFSALTAAEFPGLRFEVSLLGALQPLPAAATLDAAAALLQPGVDGVLLEAQGRRATFLPQVWEGLPEPRAFLQALLHKAGLPPDRWPDGAQLWRYAVTAWEDPPDADPAR